MPHISNATGSSVFNERANDPVVYIGLFLIPQCLMIEAFQSVMQPNIFTFNTLCIHANDMLRRRQSVVVSPVTAVYQNPENIFNKLQSVFLL